MVTDYTGGPSTFNGVASQTTLGVGHWIADFWQELTLDGAWRVEEGPEFELLVNFH